MSESILTIDSSDLRDLFSDFLLSFVLLGSAFVTVPCAKSAETDESKAAMVWVIFPGFMTTGAARRAAHGWTRRRAKKFETDREAI